MEQENLKIISTGKWKVRSKLFDVILQDFDRLFDQLVFVHHGTPVYELRSAHLLGIDGDLESSVEEIDNGLNVAATNSSEIVRFKR